MIPHMPFLDGETATLIATGRGDAIEMCRQSPDRDLAYYRYLNAGYALPLVGGTDKMTAQTPVGLFRTYVKLLDGDDFTFENWCRGLRAGRTVLTSGPLLDLTVDGSEIGDTVHVDGAGQCLSVRATARSLFPFGWLELIQDGQVVASVAADPDGATTVLEASIEVHKDSWVAARCLDSTDAALRHHDEWRRHVFAHTSPVYLTLTDRWSVSDPVALQHMLWLIEGGLGHVREVAAAYPDGEVVHHHGEGDHQAFLERPFLEALSLVRDRLYGGT